MMKKNILAIVIPALLASSAANSAEIYNKNGNKLDFYGKVNGERDLSASGEHKNIDSSYGQIGFKGETQINDQITGYGQWEYRVKTGKAEGNQENVTRLAFAGIKITDGGSLDYGRNYGIMYDVESYIDTVSPFSGRTWSNGYADNYMSNHSTGLLTYRNSNFFGLVKNLKFGVQYQGKNDHSNLKQANGDGTGVSLGYEFNEGFGLVGAYSSANRSVDQKADGNGDKAESWAVGARYDANNIYLATVYAETHNMSVLSNSSSTLIPNSDGNVYNIANKTQNLGVVVQYQFDFGLRPFVSYIQLKGKDLNGTEDCDLAKYITTGATYHFNENFSVYGDYRCNLLNKENGSNNGWLSADNQAIIGVTYQF